MDAVAGPLAEACEKSKREIPIRIWAAIQAEIRSASTEEVGAYLAGAMHDGTISRLHNTARIAQSDLNWMQMLGAMFARVGARRWFYREGKRNTFVVESSFLPVKGEFSTPSSKAGYVRGYFDAEGGLPRNPADRFYLQFCQKDETDLREVRSLVSGLGLSCGSVHVPSRRVDPDYRRFYVRARSFDDFVKRVGSWHPRKRLLLKARLSRD